ncbi:MAG: acyltransferase [Burkholderiales bacterium]|jgi:peptidoglycan/LPS O-acetylase OafA/YrhL|nr:acyltransferase [Burkholderiales bacterium]
MRVPLIDPVKAIAAQLIVWHHMMLYSSMRAPLEEAFPAFIGFLANEAKYAVQVFLVIGGFLAAQSFEKYLVSTNNRSRTTFSLAVLIEAVANRYSRLIKPFGLALLLATVSIMLTLKVAPYAELERVEWRQFAAHLFLLHDVMGFDAISAGVWYVAIDFQLFVMFTLIVIFSQRLSGFFGLNAAFTVLTFTLGLSIAAFFGFNRLPELEAWAPYFFGSYGLGVIAHRAVVAKEKMLGASVIVVLVSVAMAVDFRERLLVAAGTAGFLLIAPSIQNLPNWMKTRCVNFFNQSSYPLFLIHYPVAVLLFAFIDLMHLKSVEQNLCAAFICYGFCLVAAKGLMNTLAVYEKLELAVMRNAQPGLARWLSKTAQAIS